MLEIEQESE
ncbi:unnamed protein product, partial [Allacma fusca]